MNNKSVTQTQTVTKPPISDHIVEAAIGAVLGVMIFFPYCVAVVTGLWISQQITDTSVFMSDEIRLLWYPKLFVAAGAFGGGLYGWLHYRFEQVVRCHRWTLFASKLIALGVLIAAAGPFLFTIGIVLGSLVVVVVGVFIYATIILLSRLF